MASADVGRLDKVITGKQAHLDTLQKDQAVLEQQITALSDLNLMEKIRENGAEITVNMKEQLDRSWRGDPNVIAGIRARVKDMPMRWTVAMARPTGMLRARSVLLMHMRYEEEYGRGSIPFRPLPAEREWPMYFATADFTSLFNEMQRDFTDQKIEEYVADLIEEWGPRGQFVVGFDNIRYPIVRVSKQFADSTPDIQVPADPFVHVTPEDPYADRMTLVAMAFQWRTDEDGKTEIFAGLRSGGDTFRSTVFGNVTARDALLIAWMLSSKQLRMLEATTQRATANVPPRARKDQKKVRDETVTVVTLRKAIRAQVEDVRQAQESGRHLYHRFIVRGHWRNQAYGTNRALRRRTYILPYVKGPQDAPFIDREKVYQW